MERDDEPTGSASSGRDVYAAQLDNGDWQITDGRLVVTATNFQWKRGETVAVVRITRQTADGVVAVVQKDSVKLTKQKAREAFAASVTQQLKGCGYPEELDAKLLLALEEAASSARAPSSATAAEPTAAEAWAICADLASKDDILADVVAVLEKLGVTGESRNLKLLYLAVTSRRLRRPVNVIVKGPSSAGKSFQINAVVRLYPTLSILVFTSMSERALIYTEESLEHRTLVVQEATGIDSDFLWGVLRSCLSEGQITYVTVEKGADGKMHARRIVKPGPTGLILSTCKVVIDTETETRMLSITVRDDPDHTKAILTKQGDAAVGVEKAADTDELVRPWHALQQWLSTQSASVVVPFARAITDVIPPIAVRLRRDVPTVLSLVMAHALLHQATRQRDAEGRIVATLADYRAVHALVADLVADGIAATVSPTMRATVEAVGELAGISGQGVTIKALASELGLDHSAAWRRAKAAMARGYLRRTDEKKGQRILLLVGDPLPSDVVVLPDPDTVAAAHVGTTEQAA